MKLIAQSKRSTSPLLAACCLLILAATLVPEIAQAANPVYGWTKRIGGTGGDETRGGVVDASGNVYITGFFSGNVNFAEDFGGVDTKTSGGCYITRINANGTYGWTRRYTASGQSVAVDANGNVYITGGFSNTVNFAEDFGGNDPKTSAGSGDIFVTRINADGTYGWTKRMGGTYSNSSDWPYDITVDSSGNVYLTGIFFGTVNFAADFGGNDAKTVAGTEAYSDIFVTRINANGTYGWTKRMGSTQFDYASGISVDSSGNVFVTGSFQLTVNFAADWSGSNSKTSAGYYDAFVTRINANGTYGWTKRMGGLYDDSANDIDVDSSGNLYLTGFFHNTVNFAADFGGSDSKTSAGGYDIFIARINADGTYGWTKRIGGTDGSYSEVGTGVSVDTRGNLYVTGWYYGTVNFAADFGGTDTKSSGGTFVTRIKTNGTYVWTKKIIIERISSTNFLYSNGELYVAGYFTLTKNFASDFGASDSKTSAGGNDCFLTKIIDPPDVDDDGLPDSLENPSSCPNMSNPDSDGDGLCDGNLTVAGICVAGEDLDVDGVVDASESNPCNANSDGDALNDGADCAKPDPAHWSDCGVCVDADADNYGANCNLGPDCDDNASTGGSCHNTCSNFYRDSDVDAYGNNNLLVNRCIAPGGYISDNTDCDDANGFTWNTCATCVDADLDSWFVACNRYFYSELKTIGAGTNTLDYLLRTSSHDARTQVIYLASEIGGAGSITSIALDVSTIPGQVMNNFTIRMKLTGLSAYSAYSWEGPSSGWTTVYQANEPQGTTGWRTFTLSTPFAYNGTQNLMVDFSFNNTSYTTAGYVRYTNSGQIRTLYNYTNSAYGDPLTWVGTSNPTPAALIYIPNVRFNLDRSINGPDCDDATIAIYPGAPELCDSLDNQCPGDHGYGVTDEGCGATDTDGDGLTDDAETTIYHTNPNDPDSDDDGVNDGDEVNTYHTLPLEWDSDGDLLPDKFEIDNLTNPAGALDPNDPADGDTDFEATGQEDENPNNHEYWNGTDLWAKDPVPDPFGNPACYYWAEGDGDGVPGPGDLSVVKDMVASGLPTYDNVLPRGTFDTQDVDKDGVPGPGDISSVKDMVTGINLPSGYPAMPVSLGVVSAPGGAVDVGDTCHVTVEVVNQALAVTHSGAFAVVFSIDPSSTGAAVLLGGEGEDLGQGFTNRYDVSGLSTAGGRANIVLKLTAPGTVIVRAKVPACGIGTTGRWCAEVELAPAVVITAE